MNSKKLVYGALELEELERVPVIPQITYGTASWVNISILEGLEDYKKQVKALVFGQKECFYDGIYCGWEGSFVLLANALGSELNKYEDQTPTVKSPIIKNEDDIKKLNLSDLETRGMIPSNINLIKTVKKEVPNVPILSYIPGPFTLAGLLFDFQKYIVNIFRNPDLVKKAVKFCTEATIKLSELKIKAGADILTMADPTASCDIIPPRKFEELSLPYLKDVFSELEGKVKLGLHICGKTIPIISKMATTGATFLEVDAKNDLSNVMKEVGGKICISGNIDTSNLLMKNQEEIVSEIKDCLDKGGEKGFILSSGCEVANGTPIENVKKMVQLAKK
ncbi:MAG: uroporphyrinogen decarboxylase family protein [Candidatus Helarchaeota archaeon]